MTRVFITGMGAITPIGNDVQTYWRNLLAGTPGASRITAFATDDMPHNMACEVKGFDAGAYLNHKTPRRMHRSTQFAVAVSKQALADAEFTIDESNWDYASACSWPRAAAVSPRSRPVLWMLSRKAGVRLGHSSSPALWPTL